MPIYEYRCAACKVTIEELKKVEERDIIPPCPNGKNPCELVRYYSSPPQLDLRGDWKTTTGKLDRLIETERWLDSTERYVDLSRRPINL